MMKRKLFFGEFQVLRVKSRIYGKALPPSEVLVKLRAGPAARVDATGARCIRSRKAFS